MSFEYLESSDDVESLIKNTKKLLKDKEIRRAIKYILDTANKKASVNVSLFVTPDMEKDKVIIMCHPSKAHEYSV